MEGGKIIRERMEKADSPGVSGGGSLRLAL